jgi:hypothetical protein
MHLLAVSVQVISLTPPFPASCNDARIPNFLGGCERAGSRFQSLSGARLSILLTAVFQTAADPGGSHGFMSP